MRWGWGVRGFDGSCEGKSEVYLERILIMCRSGLLRRMLLDNKIQGLNHIGHR